MSVDGTTPVIIYLHNSIFQNWSRLYATNYRDVTVTS